MYMYPMFFFFFFFFHVKRQFCERNLELRIQKFPSLVLFRIVIMLQHLIIQFLLFYLSSGCLCEVKTNRKFQTFSSRSGCGRFREVVAYKRFQITIMI